jgi:putative heme transporter
MPSDHHPFWRRRRPQLYALTLFLWALVGWVILSARGVLLPFVLAGLAAYVIDPVIVRLSRTRIAGHLVPRWTAVLLVYVFIGATIWLAGISIFPQVYREAMRGLLEFRDFLASVTPERIDAWAAEIDGFLDRYGIPVDVVPGGKATGARFQVDLAAGIAEALRESSELLRGRLGDVVAFSRVLLTGTVAALFFLTLLFMITAFISMDAPRIIGYFESLVPASWRRDFRRLLHGIDAGLSGVVRGQLTIMLVNGVFTLVGLLVLQIPYAFALSAIATILYIVPIFGTILSSVPIVLLALSAGGFGKGLLALGWIVVIHALEAYVLNPKIMGDAARIHPVLVVLALVIGERAYGIVGALLAVPFASVFVAIFRFLHRKLAELDDKAAVEPPVLPESAAPPDERAPPESLKKGSLP